MGHAKYVGRVGALAVALGIGAAVANTPGVAWADPASTPTADSPQGTTTTGGAQPASGNTSVGGTGNDNDDSQSTEIDSDSTDGDPETETEDLAETEVEVDVPPAAGDAVLEEREDAPMGEQTPSGSSLESLPDLAVPVQETAPVQATEETGASSTPVATADPGSAVVADEENQATRTDEPVTKGLTGDVAAALGSANQAGASRYSATLADDGGLESSASTFWRSSATDTGRAPAVEVPKPTFFESLVALPGTVVSGVLHLVTAALAPVIGPGAPLDTPSLWGALLLVSRQFDRRFANRTPALDPDQTSQDLDDGQVHGTFGGTDADGDALTYRVPAPGALGGPTHGTVVINQATGTWTYTPDDNGTPTDYSDDYTGTDTFTVIASDASTGFHIHALGQTHARAATVSVQVHPITVDPPAPGDPRNPYTPAAPQPGDPVGTVRGTVNAIDPQGLPIIYSYSGPSTTPDGSSVVVNPNGSFVYTPSDEARHAAAAGTNTYTFTVTATNTRGAGADIDVTVPVGPTLNQNPQAPTPPAAPTVDHSDGTVTGAIGYTDPDGDPLRYRNPDGSSATTWTTTKGGTVTVDPTTGVYTYTPDSADRHPASADNAAATGADSDTFTVVVSDRHGFNQAVTVRVPVDPTNEAPTAPTTPAPPVVDPSDGTVTGTIGYTDPDGDPLYYRNAYGTATTTWTTNGGGTVTLNPDGSYRYTPTADQRHAAAADNAPDLAKSDIFTVIVSDGHGSIQSFSVTVAIDPTNQAPEAPTADPESTVDHDTGAVASTIGYTDPDSDTLTYTGPATGRTTGGGAVTVNPDGSYSYTPTTQQRLAAYSTAGADVDTFNVTIEDGHGSTQTVAVTVTIDPAGAAVTSTKWSSGTPGATTVGPDGTRYQITANTHHLTVTITRTDGTITTTTPIPGQAYFRVEASSNGARLTTVDGSAVRITKINLDGTTVTSTPGTGSPRGTAVGSDGTIAQDLYESSGDTRSTKILVLHPDGTTTITPSVPRTGTAFNNDDAPLVVGADGTVAKAIVNGSGSATDPYTVSLLVIRQNADGSVTTTITTPVEGRTDNVLVGANGTVGFTTTPNRVTASDPYQARGIIVRPSGSYTTFTMASDGSYWADVATRLSIGIDGTAAASNPGKSVAVIRPDGSFTSYALRAGPAFVGGDGTVYVTPYANNLLTVIHPDSSVTTTAATAAVGADGTAYITSSGGGGTLVTVIRPNGTTVALPVINGTRSGAVQFDQDGGAYQVTSVTSGGIPRTIVTALHPGAPSTTVITVDGMPHGNFEFGPDGTVYFVTYNSITDKSVLAGFRPSDGTTRTSTPIDGAPNPHYQSNGRDTFVTTAADGTAAFATSTASTSTLAVLRPDGSTHVAPPAGIRGTYNDDLVIRSDGLVYLLTSGDDRSALSVIRPDGTAVTSTPVAGRAQSYIVSGTDGSFAFGTYTYTATPDGGAITSRLTVVRADGSTVNSDPIEGTPNQIVLGTDGTAAMASGVRVAVIHPDGSTTTTDPIAGYSGGSVDVSDTGRVYQLLHTSGSYETTVVVIGPDGTISDPIVVDGITNGLVFGPGGLAYLPTQSFTPSAATFTVIRPDGTYTTAPSLDGRGTYYGGGLVVTSDGTVYESTSASGFFADGYRDQTTVRIFRPNGDVNTVTMFGSAMGGVAIAPDGTVTQETYAYNYDTTAVNTITVAPQPPLTV